MVRTSCGHLCVICYLRKLLTLVVLSIVVFLIFITSLLINLFQLLNYVAFYNSNRKIQRYINCYLQEILFCQITTIIEWYCGTRMRVFFADKKTKEKYGTEHSLVIGNHAFQIDAAFYWIYSNMFKGSLGASKAFAKEDLRMMPIMGWAFTFGEFIFLKRNWLQDQKSIGPALDRYMEYDFPFFLLILPEGTRFTPEKHLSSQTYARENNIPYSYKYHLLPRVKGFAHTLKHLRTKYSKDKFAVYQIELVQRKEQLSFEPNLKNFIKGKPFQVDVYVERFESDQLPIENASENDYGEFLYKVFQKKDQLLDEYNEYSYFSNCYLEVKKRSVVGLMRFLFFNIVMSGGLVLTLIYWAVISHSILLRLFIYGLFLIAYLGIFVIVYYMQNSKYGVKTKKAKLTDGNPSQSN